MGIACCVVEGQVCEAWWGGGALAWSGSVWPKGPPSAFPLPVSRSQDALGCVSTAINFSNISEMTFGGISNAKPGRGWPNALLTRPWELPRLCRRDLCHCRALKYHSSALSSLYPVYALLDTGCINDTHFPLASYYPFLSYTEIMQMLCLKAKC